jgi:hypothetical protein
MLLRGFKCCYGGLNAVTVCLNAVTGSLNVVTGSLNAVTGGLKVKDKTFGIGSDFFNFVTKN